MLLGLFSVRVQTKSGKYVGNGALIGTGATSYRLRAFFFFSKFEVLRAIPCW